MSNATLTGNSSGNGATLTNAVDGSGTPRQNEGLVTLQTSGVGVSGSGRFYDVNFQGGADTLIASNMVWVNPDSGSEIGFDTINMGTGNDFAHLTRSAFYTGLDMGDGADTLIMDRSGGQAVSMGIGNDFARLDLSGTASEEEMAQKVGADPMSLNGDGGVDTLNLVGDWTLTLSAGSFTLDTDGNGSGDFVTNVLRSDQFHQVVNMPTLLSGTVQWGPVVTLSNGDTVVARALFSNFEHLNAVCFTTGTLIDTPGGRVPVERLQMGDLVMTREGAKPIRWIGKRQLDIIDLMANPKLLPIRVPAGAFGLGKPERDLAFSPQHRLVVRSDIARRMFGTDEVLVAVKQLVGLNGIEVDGAVRAVGYWHFMLEDHAVVTVEGIEAETLLPGPQALSFLGDAARAEVMALFPDLFDDPGAEPPPALPLIKGREGRALAHRHAKAALSLC